jgi:hypothetical protein
MIYLINCKNLCKCYNVPLPSTIKKKINKMKKVIKIYLDLKVHYKKIKNICDEKRQTAWFRKNPEISRTNTTNFQKVIKKTHLGRIHLFHKM